jgi:hypothetical protein
MSDEKFPRNPGDPSDGDERELDRFDAFLIKALADYNRPPETPRDAMWTQVCGALPFPSTVRDALAAYNTPPATPVEIMWPVIEEGGSLHPSIAAALRDYNAPPATPAEIMWEVVECGGVLHPSIAAALQNYNKPPETPADEMWECLRAQGEIDPAFVAPLAEYNRPRAVPRESMWEVIAAARARTADPVDAALEEYNRPPAGVPREEMWSVVADVISDRTDAKVLPFRRRVMAVAANKRWLSTAAAAAVLIAISYSAGRFQSEPTSTAPQVAATKSAADSSAVATSTDTSAAQASSSKQPASGSSNAVAQNEAAPRERQVDASTQLVAARDVTPLSTADLEATGNSAGAQIVTAQHLTQVEALFTSFKAGVTDKQVNRQMSRWAKDLLSNTRVLMDSPVGADPDRRKLLQALELVLVQMVQLSPESTSEDRDFVKKGITQGGMLSRVRAAMPSGSGS